MSKTGGTRSLLDAALRYGEGAAPPACDAHQQEQARQTEEARAEAAQAEAEVARAKEEEAEKAREAMRKKAARNARDLELESSCNGMSELADRLAKAYAHANAAHAELSGARCTAEADQRNGEANKDLSDIVRGANANVAKFALVAERAASISVVTAQNVYRVAAASSVDVLLPGQSHFTSMVRMDLTRPGDDTFVAPVCKPPRMLQINEGGGVDEQEEDEEDDDEWQTPPEAAPMTLETVHTVAAKIADATRDWNNPPLTSPHIQDRLVVGRFTARSAHELVGLLEAALGAKTTGSTAEARWREALDAHEDGRGDPKTNPVSILVASSGVWKLGAVPNMHTSIVGSVEEASARFVLPVVLERLMGGKAEGGKEGAAAVVVPIAAVEAATRELRTSALHARWPRHDAVVRAVQEGAVHTLATRSVPTLTSPPSYEALEKNTQEASQTLLMLAPAALVAASLISLAAPPEEGGRVPGLPVHAPLLANATFGAHSPGGAIVDALGDATLSVWKLYEGVGKAVGGELGDSISRAARSFGNPGTWFDVVAEATARK